MKYLRLERFKYFNVKLLAVLVLAAAFSFAIAAMDSHSSARWRDMDLQMLAYNTEDNVKIAEGNLSVYQKEGGEALVKHMEQKIEAMKRAQAAYLEDDLIKAAGAEAEAERLYIESKELGNFISAEELTKARYSLEFYTILSENGISLRLTETEKNQNPIGHDGTGAIGELFRKYMLFLLPLAAMLICADTTDHKGGAARFWLLQPRSRTAMLLSKYLAGFAASAAVIPAAVLGSFIGGCLFMGPGDLRYPVKAPPSFFSVGSEVYMPLWVVYLRSVVVMLCALAFFTALALLVNVIIKNWIAAAFAGAAVSAAGVFFNEKLVIAQVGGMGRLIPFNAADAYTAALGKSAVYISPSGAGGLISASAGSAEVIIRDVYPGILFCAILIASCVLCLFAACFIFKRQDVSR